MKILFKCLKNRWFYSKTDEEMEVYYLELDKIELTDNLNILLSDEKYQIDYQLENFGKIYIIIDEDLKYSKCIPAGYGPYWPASGHWDMKDMFRYMYGIKVKKLGMLKYIKKLILEYSLNYLKNNNGLFGNVKEFNLGNSGPEMLKSFLAESIIYNYLLKNNENIIVPKETKEYSLISNNKKIIIKTNSKKNKNVYNWYGDNSCWRISSEINKISWDYLFFVEINWNGKRYKYINNYKISRNDFINNNILIDQIKNRTSWFAPVEFNNHRNWLNKYKTKDHI